MSIEPPEYKTSLPAENTYIHIDFMTIKIRVLGSGPSSGVPSLKCRINGGCQVCNTVRRTNVSILITKYENKNVMGSVLIDCGKHFFDQYNDFFDTLNIDVHSDRLIKPQEIDNEHLVQENRKTSEIFGMSQTEQIVDTTLFMNRKSELIPELVLTHPHADAIGGIDTLLVMNRGPASLYCCPSTLKILKGSFPYYFKAPGRKHIRAYFPDDQIVILKNEHNFTVSNIQMCSYIVQHGDSTSLGFLIEEHVLYISDCSELTDTQLERFSRLSLKYLFIDCLALQGNNFGHLNLSDVQKYVTTIRPQNVILIGCSHEIPNVKAIGTFIVAYDGMEIEV